MLSISCALPRRRGGSPRAILAGALSLSLWLSGSPASAAGLSGYEYLSPRPGSERVSPWNNIVVRRAGVTREAAIGDLRIIVEGSRSGPHVGDWTLADDTRTRVFTPARPFTLGELVTVRLEPEPGAIDGERIPAATFSFSIASHDPKQPLIRGRLWESPDESEPAPRAGSELPPALERALTPQLCDTMPTNYFPVTVMTSNNPDPGYIFLSFRKIGISGGRLVILDNLGVPIFHRFVPSGVSDFAMQPNGLLTYYATGGKFKYYGMDSTYTVVDSFATGNGYRTDSHELVLMPNGNALLMAYDPQPVDMSAIVPGGDPDAAVTGLIIQELDASKNVVFQWRSWDHFQITDMVEIPGRSLTDPSIDYVHGNAIEPDQDGHVLISSRHLNEITKIDRQTGDIIWRLGLNAKNNQFTFVNEYRGFSHQHDIRRLGNGHVTLFDNGNAMDTLYTRLLEYDLDEQNLIATKIGQFQNDPLNYGRATGSHRVRANGGRLAYWGQNAADPRVTDLHADGTMALALGFGDTLINGYRARRHDWRTNLFVPIAQSLDFGVIAIGGTSSLPLTIHNNAATPVELTCFASTHPTISVTEAVPITVPAGGNSVVHVQFAPTVAGPVSAQLYLRSLHETELVAQVVAVTGTGSTSSGVGPGVPGSTWLTIQPNPGQGTRTLAFHVPAPSHVTLEIYGIDGRRVATPFAGLAPAGTHEVVWDGRLKGRRATSGVYFAKLSSTFGTLTTKLVNLSK